VKGDEQARFRRVNEALVKALPELRSRYEEETEAWGEEMGPHVIYADVLNPYLTELLQSPGDPRTSAALSRVFAFLETLAEDADPEAANVATTTVAEHLESEPELLDRARPFMAPSMAAATRKRLSYRVPKRLQADRRLADD
jgi:hypothetical protein